MRHSFVKYTAAAALATGMVFAQAPASPSPSPVPKAHEGRRGFMRNHLKRISQALNLTDAQKEQSRTIFQQARQSAQPLRQQLKQNREALAAAVKADKGDSEIQQLSTQQGQLLGQLVAIRTESSAKFYQILTPEQRAKADQLRIQFRGRRNFSEHKNG